MGSIQVCVDIDLDEVDTDDLVEEVCRRLRRAGGRKSLSDREKKELKESFSDLSAALSMIPIESIEVKTLDDKMKYEHLASVFNKYTSSQIESALP